MNRRHLLALPFATLAPVPVRLPVSLDEATYYRGPTDVRTVFRKTQAISRPGMTYWCTEPEYVGRLPVRRDLPSDGFSLPRPGGFD